MARDLAHAEGVELADAVNDLFEWLSARDLYEPTVEDLENATGYERADVIALYGASILAGADVFVSALKEGLAKTSLVSGGRGHTTEGLIATILAEHPGLVPEHATEADALVAYLEHRGEPAPDLIERRSTNCGNNVSFTLDVLRGAGIDPDTIIVVQAPIFMRRMKATFELQEPSIRIIGLPAYDVRVAWADGIGLVLEQPTPHGMWPIERFMDLLSGEVPRLRNDKGGYGPEGEGYLAVVRVPPEIEEAQSLLEAYIGGHRKANHLYARPVAEDDVV